MKQKQGHQPPNIRRDCQKARPADTWSTGSTATSTKRTVDGTPKVKGGWGTVNKGTTVDWSGTTAPSATRSDGTTFPTRRAGWSYHIDPLNFLSEQALWTVLPQEERDHMAIHFHLNQDEIATIANNCRYEDYVRCRLWQEREPIVAQQFKEGALDCRIEGMTKLEAYLQNPTRRQLTCTTGDPTKIRSELERDYKKYQF